MTPPDQGVHIHTNDKVGHFLAYLTLSIHLCFLFDMKTTKILLALTGTFLYGILIEILQGFVGREQSVFDAMANAMGIAAGFLIYQLLGKYIRKLLVILKIYKSIE